MVGYIGRCHHSLRVLNRIPKGALIPVVDALQRLIKQVLDRGSELAWDRLLSFSYWGLRCPGESGGGRQVSISTLVRQQVAQFLENTDHPVVQVTLRTRYRVRAGDETIKRRVAAKFAEGDVSGAVRELASAEGLAPQDGDTLRALKEKHPSSPENLSLPDPPDGSVVPAVASEEDVRKGILSFHAGASGGPDGLRPGHLRSLLAHGSAEAESRLLPALTDLVNVMLRGEVPQFAVPVLYGANECAIRKKDGGIQSIAVGSTFRRLSVKVGSRPVVRALGEELRPVQLGVSTSGACEAAAHAARRYVRDCRHRRVLLKIDMRNAFNSLRRDSFLSVARVRTTGLYNLLWQAYSSPTRLFFCEEGFVSETGIQQGHPIARTLFCSIG